MHRLPHLFQHRRGWMLLVLAVGLLAGHGFILHYLFSHVAVSATVGAVAVALLVIKHLGSIAS